MRRGWRVPRLGRKGQTVAYLLVSLGLAIPLWGQLGFPLPTLEMEIVRYQHRLLLPESTHIAVIGEENWFHPFAVTWGSGYVFTGVILSDGRLSNVTLVPEEAETMLLPMPGNAMVYEHGVSTSHCVLVALKVPAGTESAALELTLELGEWSRTFPCDGVEGEGLYYFLTRPPGVDERAERAFEEFVRGQGTARWHAVFYDGAGGVLDTVDGSTGR